MKSNIAGKLSEMSFNSSGILLITAAACRSDCQTWISEAVNRRRSFGIKRATDEVARFYQLTVSRVIEYRQGKVNSPPAHEFLNIKETYREDLKTWIAHQTAETEKLQSQLAAWSVELD